MATLLRSLLIRVHTKGTRGTELLALRTTSRNCCVITAQWTNAACVTLGVGLGGGASQVGPGPAVLEGLPPVRTCPAPIHQMWSEDQKHSLPWSRPNAMPSPRGLAGAHGAWYHSVDTGIRTDWNTGWRGDCGGEGAQGHLAYTLTFPRAPGLASTFAPCLQVHQHPPRQCDTQCGPQSAAPLGS